MHSRRAPGLPAREGLQAAAPEPVLPGLDGSIGVGVDLIQQRAG